MTSSNIKQTCEAIGLVATCSASDCVNDNGQCTTTALTNCDAPMSQLSEDLCGQFHPSNCDDLAGVFIFRYWSSRVDGMSGDNNDNDDEGGNWIWGSNYQNLFALCAENAGKSI